ncbi:hypothetical protein KR093_011340 [Drosophila rubida]|uniref:Fork-head domain-containing protein n=1 Tax=Drosophila rubida TaxID=30044 RepID=A0AAD4PMV0_9MUSC|nr:hypothetical protein KR093_011340 [Drosophila rubida]
MMTNPSEVQEDKKETFKYISGSPDIDESDEERELTNLNWLLRNQNVTWPEIIDGNSNDDIITNISVSTSQRSIVTATKVANINTFTNFDCQKGKKIYNSKTNIITCSETRKQNSTTVASLKRLSPSERFEIFINKIKRDLEEYEKSAIKYKTDITEKPPFNYSHIIGMAMLDYGRATLQQICSWIESKFAFFRVRKKWNNSIRHNLSLHHCFRNRKREEKGKGGYWELGVDPKKCDRKRIRNRKTGQTKLLSPLQLAKNNCSQKTRTIINCNQQEESIQLSLRRHPSYNYLAAEKIEELNVVEQQAGSSKELNTSALELSISNDINRDHGRPSLCSNEFAMSINSEELQQQYERGTIIIHTSGDSLCLNDIFINNKFNNINMIYTEDEIPTLSENVIISSHMPMDINKDTPTIPVISAPEIPNVLSTSCDLSSFRTCIDGEDESFNFINSSEINRNDDILYNLLDVCVRDY